MNEPILSIENLSKKFCRSLKRSLWYGVEDMVSEMLLRRDERDELRQDEFWALKDVSFELHRGETMGLIGHNGAGKSTLLKLINGLIRPDTGCIRVRGRVGALIELGAGFNPILTGRENIYVNAAVLGLRRQEVDRRLDEIVDFAEIGDFIDAPLQTYSSGMKVRLGFSVAANLNPDILLIDEVLSVGDSSFRQRCLDRLADYKRHGGTIIFVSHNSIAVEAISDRVMLLEWGRVLDIGEPAEVVQKYEARALELSRQADQRLRQRQTLDSVDDIRFTAVECYDMDGNPKSEFEFREPFVVRLQYAANRELRSPGFIVSIHKSGYGNVGLVSMFWDGIQVDLTSKQGVVRCLIEAPQFSPGNYSIHVGVIAKVSSSFGKKWYTPLREYAVFTVLPGSLRHRFPGITANCLVSMPPLVMTCAWELNGQLLSAKGSSARGACENRRID